jgi:O-antigen ligase
MSGELLLNEPATGSAGFLGALPRSWSGLIHSPLDRTALLLALWSVPISIAVAESFLAIAVLARMVSVARGEARIALSRCFWFWLAWAGLEILVWAVSPQPARGWDEIRHLFLLAVLFLVLPALGQAADQRLAWEGIFLTSTLSSVFLVGDFVSRLFYYRREISAGGDVALYLRSGGLLNHWMVYGTVEVLVVAGLISFWSAYPEERRRAWPVVAINGIAVVLSLTRMLWVTSLLLLGITRARRRSKWIWALPLLPLSLYVLGPTAVRLRVRQSITPSYYSNAERLEMLRVAWRMVRAHPLTGVGPGRVAQLYLSYLSPHDPVPAWHGHLHNTLAQIAAQFGIPVTLAALLFVAVLFHDLVNASRAVQDQDERFIVRAAILCLVGYTVASLFEYTYGHSLGLILLAFAVLPPLLPAPRSVKAKDRAPGDNLFA